MERRLARGADKCIHAVPGLLEAVSGAGLDALLSTRPRGDLEVDLGDVFPQDVPRPCPRLSLRPIGATVARQIPVLKVTRSNRVSVTRNPEAYTVDGTPTGI